MAEHAPIAALAHDTDAPAPLWQRIFAAGHSHRPQLLRYGLPLILVFASLLLRVPVDPMIGDRAPYIFFFPAILVSSFFGGFGPGLLATVASAGLVLIQMGAPGHLDQPDLLNTTAYTAVSPFRTPGQA